MKRPTSHTDTRPWRIIVVGAEDVAQRLRKAGHRVLALDELPVLGIGTADAAVLELGPTLDARMAHRFRSKLVEPILIHRRKAERARSFVCIRRWCNGSIRMDLVTKALENAVLRTALLKKIEEEDGMEGDAPTEVLTLELSRPKLPTRLTERTVVARRSMEGS